MDFEADLIGQRFNRLVVVKYIRNKRVLCQCDCGSVKQVDVRFLLSGDTQSCGCLNKERADNKRIDISGRRFGKLVAKQYVGPSRRGAVWHCVCDCGAEKDVPGNSLRSRLVTSCGCNHYGEKRGGRKCKDLSGMQFGKLTVVSRAEDYISPSGCKQPVWLCKCECGNSSMVMAQNLKNGRTNSCGCSQPLNITRMRHAYEDAYGEVPDGYVVTALDSDTTNISADNLIAIPKSDYILLGNRGMVSVGNSDIKLAAIKTIALERAIAKIEKEL